jgi:hypothetical protein
MFYYVEVHLLDHCTQWIKMHGETVKLYYVCLCMYMIIVDMYNKQPKLILVSTQKKQY